VVERDTTWSAVGDVLASARRRVWECTGEPPVAREVCVVVCIVYGRVGGGEDVAREWVMRLGEDGERGAVERGV
jgi:hypothetical protein